MAAVNFSRIFSDENLVRIFPPERSAAFFEALFGDDTEGAFDIVLHFAAHDEVHNSLLFELQLKERPGKCLACNLTYGLPEVLSRHPVIDLAGVVSQLGELLAGGLRCGAWSLGHTRPLAKKLHIIPLTVSLS